MKYEMIVIGTSAGGIDALKKVFSEVKEIVSVSIVISFHLTDVYARDLPMVFDRLLREDVIVVSGKEVIVPGKIYFAPPMYHMKREEGAVTLTLAERQDGTKSPIDLLFETAVQCYGDKLAGIVLTGANCDGAEGLKRIEVAGGKAIVQEPATAYASAMPMCALDVVNAAKILDLEAIGIFIDGLHEKW